MAAGEGGREMRGKRGAREGVSVSGGRGSEGTGREERSEGSREGGEERSEGSREGGEGRGDREERLEGRNYGREGGRAGGREGGS